MADAGRDPLGDVLARLTVRLVEVHDREAVGRDRELEGLRDAVRRGVVEAHLDLDLGHLVARVVHDDLLGDALVDQAVGVDPHLGRRRGAEPEGDALVGRIGAVEGLDAIDDEPAAPDDHVRGDVVPPGVLLDEDRRASCGPGTTRFWSRSGSRVPSSVASSTSTVASSGNGFMNTSSSRAPRAVMPHGNDHSRAAVELHGRGGPPAAALAEIRDLVLHGDLAAVDLDDGARERRVHEVAQGHVDPALRRELAPRSAAGGGDGGRGGRRRRRRWSSWSSRGGRLVRRPRVAPRRDRREHRDRRRARLVGGVGDQQHVVGQPARAGGAAGAVPGGAQRRPGRGGRHGDAGHAPVGRWRRGRRRTRRPRRGRGRRRRRRRAGRAR